ncbi:hypothetical protein FQR65_LT03503 [Abscondita terminalis]|nr:hypothetical protein FQR65_LT03503 [Abscondita terminalis]
MISTGNGSLNWNLRFPFSQKPIPIQLKLSVNGSLFIMEQNVIQMPDLDYVPDERGLGYVYFHSMVKNCEKLAQIDGLTGEKISFGELLQRAVRVALHMKDVGVKAGDIVCTCSFNHPNVAVPTIASMFVGAIWTAVAPTSSVVDIAHMLRLVKPKMMFVQNSSVDLIKKALNLIDFDAMIVIFEESAAGDMPFSKFLQRREDEATFAPWIVKSVEDTAFIVFSSGTAGYSKAISYNHYTFLCHVVNKRYISDESMSLCLYYAWPSWAIFITITNASIIRGWTRLMYRRFDPSKPWDVFNYKITFMFMTVVQLANMCKQAKPEHVDTSSLRHLEVGADFARKNQMLEWKKIFPKTTVRLVYGLTELLTIFEASDPKDDEIMDQKLMSVGTPIPGYSYKIVDLDTGKALGPNRQGELRVKTKVQTKGYYKSDSSNIWDSEGWFKTGEVGYYDDDHCFFVVKRINEMFNYQYFHIIPRVIEDVINLHPAVARSLVVGTPHPEDVNHPLAYVVLHPNCSQTSEKELEKFVEEKVEEQEKLRGGVKIVKNLPVTRDLV